MDRRRGWHRRRVLRGVGSLSAALLAGCFESAARSQTERSPETSATPANASVITETAADPGSTATPTSTKSPSESSPTPTSNGSGDSDGILLPSVDVEGSPGGLVKLRPAGKAALLDFFATWCQPCKVEIPNLRAARERFSQDEAVIVSITRETDRAAIKQFWKRYDGTWPALMDPGLRAFRKYGVTNIPTIVVFAPDGTRVMRHTGLAGEDRIVDAIETAQKSG